MDSKINKKLSSRIPSCAALAAVCVVTTANLAEAKTCFNLVTNEPVTKETCGPVKGSVEIKNCETQLVEKKYSALLGVDCKSKPVSIKALYHSEMLVGEYNTFSGVPFLVLSKTFSMQYSKKPAREKDATPGHQCFTMAPLDTPNEKTCDAVEIQLTMRDCKTKKPISPLMNVKAHFTCLGKQKRLKYWYKDSLLVGLLNRDEKGKYKIGQTYSLQYPEIYGSLHPLPNFNKRKLASQSRGKLVAESCRAQSKSESGDPGAKKDLSDPCRKSRSPSKD